MGMSFLHSSSMLLTSLLSCMALLGGASSEGADLGWHNGQGLEADHRTRRLTDAVNSMNKISTGHNMEFDIPIIPGKFCRALSKELIAEHAKDKMVLIMAVDKLLVKRFGRSWIHNVKAAGITYWYVAALDPWTSQALGSLNVTQCFNAPSTELGYKGSGDNYQLGSQHWHQTTWNKVFIVRAIYKMGFHVLHSDSDTTWWNDPYLFLKQFTDAGEEPPHALFTTDSLDTYNKRGDGGLELSTNPFYNINTGVYFVKQFAHGMQFFEDWLYWFPKKIGHDQDGLNNVVRGSARTGDKSLPEAKWDQSKRLIWAATSNKTGVSLFSVQGFGNTYTYITGKVHHVMNSTLYETHWVWTGGSPECKIQNMRDAMKYVDPPEYYGHPNAISALKTGTPELPLKSLMLLTMDLDRPVIFSGYNELRKLSETERMVQFHLAAADYQLQQAYWGIMAAVALDRVWVLPGFHCYCAKNWYMTQNCRINGDKHTMFPFMCSLSDLMRARKLLQGINFQFADKQIRQLHVREWPFLSNPRIAPDVLASKLVLKPSAEGGKGPVADTQLKAVAAPTKQTDGSYTLSVPWPLNSAQIQLLVTQAAGGPWRIVHLANATRIMGGGFTDASDWASFDQQINNYATYWCCRSPDDQKNLNLTDKVQLHILPKARERLLPGKQP